MLNEYEIAQAAADRARYCAPACDPAPQNATPDDRMVVHRDTLEAIVRRLDDAMRHIPLGSASDNLDTAYIDVCVAWAHARHALRGTRPTAGQPLADLSPTPVPQLRLVERSHEEIARSFADYDGAIELPVDTAALIEQGEVPCPGCVERCGQCAPDEA